GEVCGLTKLAGVRDTNVRRPFTADFIPQPQSGIEFGKPRTGCATWIALVVHVQLDLGLQDQAIRNEQIVGAIHPPRETPTVAEVERRRELEEIGRQSLDSDRSPRPATI